MRNFWVKMLYSIGLCFVTSPISASVNRTQQLFLHLNVPRLKIEQRLDIQLNNT